jgi:hypothetical protein
MQTGDIKMATIIAAKNASDQNGVNQEKTKKMPRRVQKSGYPNIQKRENPLTTSYRVTLRPKRKSISLTFYSEEEAKEWLQENYEYYMKNPEKFKRPQKKWV